MDLDRRLGRYRFFMKDAREHAAQEQQTTICDLEHIGYNPRAYHRTSSSRIHDCIRSIFSSTDWCRNYLGRPYSIVTAWSSRFPDICTRIEDVKGVYKNRPISEAICIMLVASDIYTHTFLPVVLDYVLENVDFDYVVLERVSLGIEWAVYLTQINVLIVTPKLNSIFIRTRSSHCIVFERNISTKFTSAFIVNGGIELVSTVVDITNKVVDDRYTLLDVGERLHTSEMERFSVERLVYDGSDPSDDWKIKAIGHSKLNMDKIVKTIVHNMHEYEAGCRAHQNCLGHLCTTPCGTILPIQSLSIHNANMSNVVYKAVETVLQDDTQFGKSRYIDMLKGSMKKKTGRMRRGILNCHIDGSLRMVITPQWNLPRNVVAIPSYLKDKWRVCRLDRKTSKYMSCCVEDGDRAVVVRPPSLTVRSIQPMVIRYWNETCMGISPDILKAFEGDYDGDEMHVNPVYSERALAECIGWKNTPNKTVENATSIYKSLVCGKADFVQGDYMLHTTSSFKQMAQKHNRLLMAEESRTKWEHIKSIQRRIVFKSESHSLFDVESMRGMADINRRYLTQPIVGDMSRIAKIVSSCIYQNDEGWIGIWSNSGFVKVTRAPMDISSGNAAVRGISNICACAQQVALDAHRVSRNSLPLHDMISDLVVGSKYTLVVLESSTSNAQIWKDDPDVKWICNKSELLYVICKPKCGLLYDHCNIIASYNPSVLSSLKQIDRLEACKRGIELLTQYYSIKLTRSEILSLSVLYSYRTECHTLPITTRDGMYSRELQWVETTMARHYAGLISMVDRSDIMPSPIYTVSACLLGANFLNLAT